MAGEKAIEKSRPRSLFRYSIAAKRTEQCWCFEKTLASWAGKIHAVAASKHQPAHLRQDLPGETDSRREGVLSYTIVSKRVIRTHHPRRNKASKVRGHDVTGETSAGWGVGSALLTSKLEFLPSLSPNCPSRS